MIRVKSAYTKMETLYDADDWMIKDGVYHLYNLLTQGQKHVVACVPLTVIIEHEDATLTGEDNND